MQRCQLFFCSFFFAVLLHCQRHPPCKQRPRNSHFISFSLFSFVLVYQFRVCCTNTKEKRKRKEKEKGKKEHIRGTALVKRGASPSLSPDQKPACDTHAKHAERPTVLSPPPETADVRNKKRRRGRGGGGGGVLHQQQQTSRAH